MDTYSNEDGDMVLRNSKQLDTKSKKDQRSYLKNGAHQIEINFKGIKFPEKLRIEREVSALGGSDNTSASAFG